VVLCLTGEGFARTLIKEGARSALWRGATTAIVGILLTLLSDIHDFRHMLMQFPELLIFQIGCIVAIAEYFDLRLLQHLNPTVDAAEEPEEDMGFVFSGSGKRAA
jgi:hypothetical protein